MQRILRQLIPALILFLAAGDALAGATGKKVFLRKGIELMAGTEQLQRVLELQRGAEQIQKLWRTKVEAFCETRERYLLYSR